MPPLSTMAPVGSNPDDDRPSVSITNAGTLNEGSTALFTVNLSAAADTATTVKLTLNAGDTEAGDIGTLEYFDGTNWVGVPADGIVSLAAGTTALQLRVQTNDDSVYEGAESFSVTVTGQTGTTGTATGNATIVDDGTGPGPNPDDDRPSVSITNAGTLNEGSTALFTVNLSAAADTATTVQTNDDSVYEGAESFSVTVTGQTGTTGTATGNATIVDDGTGPGPNPDDDRPSVSITNAGTLNEGSTALFTVNLSAAADTATTVELTLNAEDTEAGDIGTLEYFDGTNWVGVPADGIVSLAAGTTALQLRVQTNDDSVYRSGSEPG
ncbi:Calx-beta domain-containing protein [Aeromonas veronii]|uniref:Calx-beta domain-containing protein n=1 Tax=Aeromonas veronii TaxID=654 RepID=UPI002444348D|nr:Calx-beta domain-containing protein [Aeromonas veronii]